MGDKVTLQSDDLSGGTFKWVATKGKEIISTQGTSIFNHVFNQQGEYDVTLTITDNAGNTKSTSVLILVGERYSSYTATGTSEGGTIDAPLSVGLATLPTKTSQRSVHILGDEGRVVFDVAVRDDILEYRIDRNIFVDSDGNGIANDDIDNADDSSYLLGGVWQTKYLASESNKIASEITVVNKQGQKAKSQVEIIFEPVPDKEGNVVAVLDTLPLLDSQDKKIFLYDDLDTIAFYSRRSQGDIVEYRIDKNIFVDSDGDGNPSNDIDNQSDNSFKTGDVWLAAYERTDEQIITQLIVVGRGGTGSRIQREIEFTDRPLVIATEVSEPGTVIKLSSDKEFVQKEDPITFAVEGLVQNLESYVFDWDFDGNGEVDQTVEGENTVSYIYDTPGIHLVKVLVRDLDGNEANFSLDVLVKDTVVTTADFEYLIEENTVTFTNISVVSPSLTSKTLNYTWSFGDTDSESYEAQKNQIGMQNPTYTYTKPGTYIVSLTVVDADQVASTTTEKVVVEGLVDEDGNPIVDEVEENKASDSDSGSIIWTIFKIIFYIILAVILLVILIVVGLLAFLKIQHPDLVFEELIDELKIKILGMMGVHETAEPEQAPVAEGTVEIEPTAEPESAARPMPESTASGTVADEAEKTPEPETPAEEPDLSKADAPVPDWLKTTTPAEVTTEKPDVIEGEVEEPVSEPEPAPAPMPEKPIADEPAPAPAAPAPEPAPEAPTSADKPTGEPGKKEGEDLNKDDGPVPDWLKNA